MNGLYSQVNNNSDVTKMVFAKTLGAGSVRICPGCVVIHFQPLDGCTLDYRFADAIRMLVKEVDLESFIPIGDYTLTAKVSVSQSSIERDSGKLCMG